MTQPILTDRAKAMFRAGAKWSQIALEIGCSITTAQRLFQRAGYGKKPGMAAGSDVTPWSNARRDATKYGADQPTAEAEIATRSARATRWRTEPLGEIPLRAASAVMRDHQRAGRLVVVVWRCVGSPVTLGSPAALDAWRARA